jgi:hypothetical protein
LVVGEISAAEWARLTVGRQVWLVCRATAEKRSRRWFDVISRVALAGQGERSSGLGIDVVKADRQARLAPLQFAASDLASRLSDVERERLRTERVLPDWFVPEMLKQAKMVERELRRR